VAQTATIYGLRIDLTDMDRNVFETLDLRIARQPSETIEYMLARVLAYCLEYQDGIVLTEGVAAGDEPAVMVRDLTGKISAWIEVGMPDASRLHRGVKIAGRAAVYTHRDVRRLLAQLSAGKIHKADSIPVYAIDRKFIGDVAVALERRSELSISVSASGPSSGSFRYTAPRPFHSRTVPPRFKDRELYLILGDRHFTTTIVEHRIDSDG
jgi:uncharacterized protein YaeQ